MNKPKIQIHPYIWCISVLWVSRDIKYYIKYLNTLFVLEAIYTTNKLLDISICEENKNEYGIYIYYINKYTHTHHTSHTLTKYLCNIFSCCRLIRMEFEGLICILKQTYLVLFYHSILANDVLSLCICAAVYILFNFVWLKY